MEEPAVASPLEQREEDWVRTRTREQLELVLTHSQTEPPKEAQDTPSHLQLNSDFD